MDTKLVDDIQRDYLTCKLCNKPFNQPKALPCLHTLCKGCLAWHIQKNAVRAEDGTNCVFCPICRTICDLPPNGVEGLQDNHMLRGLLDMVYHKSNQYCDMCREDGKKRKAEYCCTKCEDFLCAECAKNHKKTRLTKDHLVINVSMMKDLYDTSRQGTTGIQPIEKIYVRLLLRLGSHGDDLCDPVSVCVNRADDVIISNSNDTVCVYAQNGECKRSIDQKQFYGLDKNFKPTRVAAVTMEGYLATAMRQDIVGNRAHVGIIQTLAGREVTKLTVKAGKPLEVEPHGIAVTSTNDIVITDVGKHCVYVFNAEYQLIKTFGKKGSKNGQFKFPYFVAVNNQNQIIVSDYGNHCVKIFDFKGKFKQKIGTMGTEPGNFIHPVGLCTDERGHVFVCDRDNHRVQMFDASGHFMTIVCQNTCKDGNDVRPQDVAMTTNGHLVALVRGVEGVDFAEIHVLQYGTSRFRSRKQSADEPTYDELSRQVALPSRAGIPAILPPIGGARYKTASAPVEPDLVRDHRNIDTVFQHYTPGRAPQNDPNSAVCNIL